MNLIGARTLKINHLHAAPSNFRFFRFARKKDLQGCPYSLKIFSSMLDRTMVNNATQERYCNGNNVSTNKKQINENKTNLKNFFLKSPVSSTCSHIIYRFM